MVLHPGQHTQLPFHGDAVGVGVFHHFPGEFHILLVGQAAAVDHHAGVAGVDAGFDGFQALAVVQVQSDGDGAVFAVFFHGVPDVFGARFLGLGAAVHKVQLSAHIGVGGLGPLEDRPRAQQLVDADGGLDLADTVHVEGSLAEAVGVGGGQNSAHGYQHTKTSFPAIKP